MTRYIVYIEIVVSVGLGIGPSIGSAVYGHFKYAWTMYLFGFIDMIGMFICIFCIPSQINKNCDYEEGTINESLLKD